MPICLPIVRLRLPVVAALLLLFAVATRAVATSPPAATVVRAPPCRPVEPAARASLSPVRAPDGRVLAVVTIRSHHEHMNGDPDYEADVLAPRPGDPRVVSFCEHQKLPVGAVVIALIYPESTRGSYGYAAFLAETRLDRAADALAALAREPG